jgi:hypothetical protein
MAGAATMASMIANATLTITDFFIPTFMIVLLLAFRGWGVADVRSGVKA